MTGIDVDTDLYELLKLQQKYPFAEWGVLVSDHHPFLKSDWIIKFYSLGLQGALHYCGIPLKEFIKTVPFHIQGTKERFEKERIESSFSRVQLNFDELLPESDDMYWTLQKLEDDSRDFILQLPADNGKSDLWKLADTNINLSFLFDSSRGQGINPTSWSRPITGVRCGYAGGLTPDNLEEKLKEIEQVVGDGFTWIDAQRGLRTNGKFDISKAENFLRIASKYVNT